MKSLYKWLRRRLVVVAVMVVVVVTALLLSSFFLTCGQHRFYSALRAAGPLTPQFSQGTNSDPTPCRRSLRFAPVPLPVTALASVQGSGNTWMRHLLQQLTGVYTGSCYDRHGDPELWNRGYYGEGVQNGSVIAVKTHWLLPQARGRFRRAVVVIRDPFEAVFADFNRRASYNRSHTGAAPLQAFFRYWEEFSLKYANRWSHFHASWINFEGPLLFINFDDLVHSLDTTIKMLADFFQHPSLRMDLRCALDGQKGAAKRNQASIDKRQVFSKNLTRHINERVEEVGALFARRFPKLSAAVVSWKRNESGLKELRKVCTDCF